MSSKAHSSGSPSPSSSASSSSSTWSKASPRAHHHDGGWKTYIVQKPDYICTYVQLPRERSLALGFMSYVLGKPRHYNFIMKKTPRQADDASTIMSVAEKHGQLYWAWHKAGRWYPTADPSGPHAPSAPSGLPPGAPPPPPPPQQQQHRHRHQ